MFQNNLFLTKEKKKKKQEMTSDRPVNEQMIRWYRANSENGPGCKKMKPKKSETLQTVLTVCRSVVPAPVHYLTAT